MPYLERKFYLIFCKFSIYCLINMKRLFEYITLGAFEVLIISIDGKLEHTLYLENILGG